MEIYIIIGLLIFVTAVVLRLGSHATAKKKIFRNNLYNYIAKESLMTKTETDFFIKLDRVVRDRYYVFPQVHLSAIFDHRVKGQEWKYAFSHINGKSVDYVLCDKPTLKPMYAIELDDYTHNDMKRRERDSEVERIFEAASLPLVRFRNKDMSEDEIIQALAYANELAVPKISS